MNDVEQIRVYARHVDDVGPGNYVGSFAPSQINALLGLARESTIYWLEDGASGRFADWQWYVADVDGDVKIELLFKD